MVHGCRQLVSWDVGLSPATSATPVFSCQQVKLGTLKRLPVINRRKVGTTSNHHALYVLGYTRTTMAITKRSEPAKGSETQKSSLSSDWRLKFAFMKPELLVMAGQHTAVNTFPGLVHYTPPVTPWELEIPEACELTYEAAVEGRANDWGEVVTR